MMLQIGKCVNKILNFKLIRRIILVKIVTEEKKELNYHDESFPQALVQKCKREWCTTLFPAWTNNLFQNTNKLMTRNNIYWCILCPTWTNNLF